MVHIGGLISPKMNKISNISKNIGKYNISHNYVKRKLGMFSNVFHPHGLYQTNGGNQFYICIQLGDRLFKICMSTYELNLYTVTTCSVT